MDRFTHFISQTVDSLSVVLDLHPYVAVRIEECNSSELNMVKEWTTTGVSVLLQSGVSRLVDVASQKNGVGASDIYSAGASNVHGTSALAVKYAQYVSEIGMSAWGAIEFELGAVQEREKWRSQFRGNDVIIPTYNPSIDTFSAFESLASKHSRIAVTGLSLLTYDAVLDLLMSVSPYRDRGLHIHILDYNVTDAVMAFPIDSFSDRSWSNNIRYAMTLTYTGLRQYGDAKDIAVSQDAGRRGNKFQRSRAFRATAYQMNMRMRSFNAYINSLYDNSVLGE